MKGILAAIAPAAVVDDAAHDIPPGDVHAAAWALAGYWQLYPSGTVHVAVIDPGVGSTRRALAAIVDDRLFVAPDNGVLTRVLDTPAERVVVGIENAMFFRDDVSSTFHGRDVFAPVAAHLARGTSCLELGHPLTDPVRLELPEPRRTAAGINGAIVHVDRFGNLVTNIPAGWIGPQSRVLLHGVGLTVRRTYADVGPAEPVALIGSRGLLEIAVRDGSAAVALSARRGDEVIVVT